MDPIINTKSPIENLPLELACAIFEYASESINDIRMCSRTLRAQVDKYVILPTKLIIVKLFSIFKSNISQDTVIIEMEDTDNLICLFEHRLKHFITGDSYPITRLYKPDELKNGESPFHTYVIEHVPYFCQHLEDLKICAGRIIMVNLHLFPNDESKVLNLLSGLQIEILVLTIIDLSEELASILLNIVKFLKVKRLSVVIENTQIPKPENCLLDLSETVQTLEIFQNFVNENYNRFLLGRHDFDWAPTILSMFSKKLDKLRIDNDFCNEYLTRNSIDMLKEKLSLVGKEVWFESTCTKEYDDVDCVINNHSVKVVPFNEHACTLSVKHLSRKEEPFGF